MFRRADSPFEVASHPPLFVLAFLYHPAAVYLDDRGYDRKELSETWDVSWCKRADGVYATAGQRLIVPVTLDGKRVGWQARFVGELDWKKTGVPKYYTLSNFKTGKTLYNIDLAKLHQYVVVCEGVADVWAVGECGVALFGKTVGGHQQDLLTHWAREDRLCVLLLDPGTWSDEAKHAAFLEGFAERMDGRVVEVSLPSGRDPGQYDRLALWRLIKGQVRSAGFDPSSYR